MIGNGLNSQNEKGEIKLEQKRLCLSDSEETMKC